MSASAMQGGHNMEHSNSLMRQSTAPWDQPWSQWRSKPMLNNVTTVLRPFFWDHPGEPVPENFWTMVQGKINRGRHTDHRLDATPSGLTSSHLHHPPIFYRPDALPAAQPTASKHWRRQCQ